MTSRTNPFEQLRQRSADRSTGELVCALPDAEVHIHLQGGRVAWATTSDARFAFTRHIVKLCDLDRDALQALVEECRRERKPLGETLIAWGIATEEQVRAALRAQIVDALRSLRSNGHAETVFLRRGAGYDVYNRQYTFTIKELAADVGVEASKPRRRRVSLSSKSIPTPVQQQLIELVEREPAIRWAEHHRNGSLAGRVPVRTAPAGIDTLAKAAFESDFELLAARGAEQSIIGFPLPGEDGSVWCGLDSDAVLGAVLTVVRGRFSSEDRARVSIPGGSFGQAVIGEDRAIPRPVLTELMNRTPALLDVALIDASGETHHIAHRERLDLTTAGTTFDRLSRFLEELSGILDPDAVGGSVSMVSSSEDGWFFGSQLLDASDRLLWLMLDPATAQGLGWALLTALLRRTSLTPRELRQ